MMIIGGGRLPMLRITVGSTTGVTCVVQTGFGGQKQIGTMSVQDNKTEQLQCYRLRLSTSPLLERAKWCRRQGDELSPSANEDNESKVAASTTAASCKAKINALEM